MDAISRHAETSKDNIAVIFGDREITYGEFNTDILSATAWMKTQGLSEGMLLGAFMPKNNYWEWVIFHAAYRLGLTHVTLTPEFNKEISIIGKLDAVISPVKIQDKNAVGRQLSPYSPPSIRTTFPRDKALEILAGHKPAACNSFQRMALTSGTTGDKKIVLWSSGILEKRVAKVAEINHLSMHTRLSTLFKMDTTAGLRYPLATWLMGGTVLFSYTDLKTRKKTSPILQSNFVISSPFRLQQLLKTYAGFWPGHTTRKVAVAGGRLPAKIRAEALERICNSITITYGATETGSVVLGDSGLIDRHAGAVGFVIPGAEAQIVDEHDQPLPSGTEGIVRTKTPYMVNQYESLQTTATPNAFRNGWFYSGDQGVIFEDGMLAICGRMNDTVNISGVKISVLDLESRIMQIDGILDVCVIKLDLSSHDSLGIAIVRDPGLSEENLQNNIQQICNNIAFILFIVADIPRNSTGKVARATYSKTLMATLAQHRPTMV